MIISFNFSHLSPSHFKEKLDYFLHKKADKLIRIFIESGPDALKETLGISDDEQWTYIFDYLIFSKDVIRKCVERFKPFFIASVREKGPMILRYIFRIEEAKYDAVFQTLQDAIGIEEGALYDFIFIHRRVLARLIMKGDAHFLRQELGLLDRKYEEMWQQTLSILQEAVCTHVYDASLVERGLQTFDMIMNTNRIHRSLIRR